MCVFSYQNLWPSLQCEILLAPDFSFNKEKCYAENNRFVSLSDRGHTKRQLNTHSQSKIL